MLLGGEGVSGVLLGVGAILLLRKYVGLLMEFLFGVLPLYVRIAK